MIRPNTSAAPERGTPSPLHLAAEPLPAPFSELLPAPVAGRAVWSIWGFDSYFRAASQSYLRLLGWTEAELSSASYWDFVHPDDQHPLVEAIDRTMATSGRLTGHPVRVLGRDGGWRRRRWDVVADQGTELMCGVSEHGEAGVHPGGSDRRRVGTWVQQDRAVTWSDEVYAMFGIPVGAALTGALVMSRVDPRDRALVTRVWRARLVDTESHGVQFRTLAADGTTRRLECTGRQAAGSDGRPGPIRGITVDVTGGLAAGRAADPAAAGDTDDDTAAGVAG